MYLKQFKKQKNRIRQGEGNMPSVTTEGLLLGHGSNKVIENVENNKIFYHGSNEKFTKFDKSKIKENKLGLCFNFTDDYSIAYQYGDNIVKVHLDLNNPLTLDIWDNIFPYEYYNKFGKLLLNEPDYEYDKQEYEKSPYTFGEMFNIYKMYPEFIQILEEMGYDSIAIPEDHHFGVFEPEQIHIIQNEQLVYHGSNSTFDKFNSDKIKEYRYGWGFYFTRSENYAKDYGNVREYEIPEDEYLLDWEVSYNYQSETVQDALYKIWQEVKPKDTELLFEKAIFGDYCNNGYWIYHTLSEVLHLSAKETSLLLYKHGIKGIYSLEGNCIVIFNSDDIRLNETYNSKGINMNFKELHEEIEKFLKDIEEQNDQELTVSNKPKLRSMADDIVDLAGETVKSVGHALTGDIFRKRKSSVNNLGNKRSKTISKLPKF